MALTADILRGYTDTIILRQLDKADSYGYQINKTVADISGGSFELKEATLYTAFRRLEQAGYIRSYGGDESAGARRRYYAITDEGRAFYNENKTEWQRIKHIIDCLIGTDC